MFDVLIPTLDPKKAHIPPCLRRFPVYFSTVKGRSQARNILAQESKADYLLFIDDDIDFGVGVLHQYVNPSCNAQKVIAYEGENPILCSRVLGIPRKTLLEVGGFDESFDVGEDQELGYRLREYHFPIRKIPRDLVTHLHDYESGTLITSYVNRARFLLRYKKRGLLRPARKADIIGLPFMLLALLRYAGHNQRRGLKCLKK